MKNIILILFIVGFKLQCLGQNPNVFKIKEVFATDTINKKNAVHFQRQSLTFFEDEKYIVRKTCRGEWG